MKLKFDLSTFAICIAVYKICFSTHNFLLEVLSLLLLDVFIKRICTGTGTYGPVPPKKLGKRTATDEDIDREALHKIILDMHERKEWPTVCKIFLRVQEELGFAKSECKLRKLLKAMGYKFSKGPTRKYLQERTAVIAKRQEYLIKVKQIRALNYHLSSNLS